MTYTSFIKTGLTASVAALMAFGVEGARAASPAAACPGEVSVGPTGDMVPAPSGMPLNCTTTFYDGTVDFAGRVTGYAYDSDAGTTTIYDQQGQLVGVTNTLGETIFLGPEKGVLSTVTDPAGHTTTFTYNSAGSVIDVASPMSSTTSYTYDSSQRLMTVTDPLGVTTTNAYDTGGRLLSSTPSMGNTTTNTYTSGQLTEEIVGSVTTMYTYNSSGQLVEMSDSLGDETKYTYDSMGRVMTETVTPPSGGLTTTITYDPSTGEITEISESGGGPTTTYMYTDDLLTEKMETVGGVTDITTYTYNSLGELISMTDPEDMTTRFTYDAYGDLLSMTDPNGSVTTFAYFVVPEPSTWAEILLGFGGLAFLARSRRRGTAALSLR